MCSKDYGLTFLLNLNDNNQVVVKADIALAKSLELEVLVEGVETIEQVNFLKNKSCHSVQGYHYFKPLPAKEITPHLIKGNIVFAQ